MSVGLVLEGGGMRGLYTAGVLDTLVLFRYQQGHFLALISCQNKKVVPFVTIKNTLLTQIIWGFVRC